jgi:hypothetical protein
MNFFKGDRIPLGEVGAFEGKPLGIILSTLERSECI